MSQANLSGTAMQRCTTMCKFQYLTLKKVKKSKKETPKNPNKNREQMKPKPTNKQGKGIQTVLTPSALISKTAANATSSKTVATATSSKTVATATATATAASVRVEQSQLPPDSASDTGDISLASASMRLLPHTTQMPSEFPFKLRFPPVILPKSFCRSDSDIFAQFVLVLPTVPTGSVVSPTESRMLVKLIGWTPERKTLEPDLLLTVGAVSAAAAKTPWPVRLVSDGPLPPGVTRFFQIVSLQHQDKSSPPTDVLVDRLPIFDSFGKTKRGPDGALVFRWIGPGDLSQGSSVHVEQTPSQRDAKEDAKDAKGDEENARCATRIVFRRNPKPLLAPLT